MVELGLPESAGTGVKAFLEALKALGSNNAASGAAESGERMDTD
jgi:hypothetical protein